MSTDDTAVHHTNCRLSILLVETEREVLYLGSETYSPIEMAQGDEDEEEETVMTVVVRASRWE